MSETDKSPSSIDQEAWNATKNIREALARLSKLIFKHYDKFHGGKMSYGHGLDLSECKATYEAEIAYAHLLIDFRRATQPVDIVKQQEQKMKVLELLDTGLIDNSIIEKLLAPKEQANAVVNNGSQRELISMSKQSEIELLERTIGENMGCYYRVATKQWCKEILDPHTKEYSHLIDVTAEVKGATKAAQALIDTACVEARKIEDKEILAFATRVQANGQLVPIEIGLVPWLEDRITNQEKSIDNGSQRELIR